MDYLLKVHNGLVQKDDLDHLGNRRVRVIGELLEKPIPNGIVPDSQKRRAKG